MKTLLVIDGSSAVRNLLEGILPECRLEWVQTAAEGFQKIQTRNYDLILTEVELSDDNGFSLLEKMNMFFEVATRGKVLFFSSTADVVSRSKAFQLGAIDFIAKSTDPSEVAIRIQSRLNLGKTSSSQPWDQISVNFGKLEVRSSHDGIETVVPMTATGFRLFHFLYLRKGKIVDREVIRNEVWKSGTLPSFRAVDRQIAELRKRLQATPIQIKTIHRFGYRLQLADSDSK